MSKRKKQQKQHRVNEATHRAQRRAADIPQQQSPDKPDQRLRAEAQRKYQRKQTGRQIIEAFAQLRSTEKMPSPGAVRDFIIKYLDEIDLMREALQPEKYASDPWSVEIWRLLGLKDSELRSELTQILAEKEFAVETAKMLVRHKLSDPLVFHTPTTTDGPDFDAIGPKAIHDAIVTQLGEDCASFDVQGDFPLSWPDEHKVRLCFDIGDPMIISIKLVLDLDSVSEDFQETWEQVDVLPVSPGVNVLTMLQDQLRQTSQHSEEVQLRIAQLLKTAHAMGYWKTVESQRLMQRWRAGNQAIKLTREAIDVKAVADVANIARLEELQENEAEKLQVLDLPPLVAHDLIHATVDVNVLQHLLFAFPQFQDLRNKALEDYSEADIRALSPPTNWQISDLKARGRRRFVGSRALAKILLSIARLQFEKLEIGTCEADIRFCLSNYSTRMGEYLVQQHGRYDLARDYYLEAISLNLVARQKVDFPTLLLFRSFPNDNRVPPPYSRGLSDFLRLLDEPRWQEPEVLHNAIRSFLELGARHFQWASRWFGEYSQATQQRLLSLARSQLGLSDLADLSDCVHAYRQEFGRFQTLLRQMIGCSSLHGIMETRSQLDERLRDLDFLLSPTNREIAGVLAQAIESLEKFLRSKSYEDQRDHADTAINLLDRVLVYGADNYTALWAEYFGVIARKWRELISREIGAIAKDIAPVLEVSLAEERISLTSVHGSGEQARVIFGIGNEGLGQANRVNVRFHTLDGRFFNTQRQNFELRPDEAIEDYFEFEPEISGNPLSLEYTVSYYDPDRQFVKYTSEKPLYVLPLIDNSELNAMADKNPFRTDQEIDDERMFVGRDHLLEEVSTYAIDQPRGSLLMLHGQRRVGKSSLLLFLERGADRVGVDKQVLGVRVTWLNHTDQSAPILMYEIAIAIQRKYKQQYGRELSIPDIHEFQSSYSFAFNNMLRELESSGIRRLILMWDEFDGLVNNLDKPEMRFDRIFFEYLRGLSKRKGVTLVLIGGELMPILFERWGEVFNHDRTWRIAYLSPTDGSVERLVRNDYVKNVLSFSDDAVDMIKECSACNPFFVQLICRELVNTAKSQKSPQVCRLDVEEVVKWLVQRGLDPKYMRHLYSPRLKPDPLDMAIIDVTAEEELSKDRPQFVSQQAILMRITKKYEDEVINRIGELVRREILQRNPDDNSEIRMMLPLFRDWFYDNHPEYQLWAPLLRR